MKQDIQFLFIGLEFFFPLKLDKKCKTKSCKILIKFVTHPFQRDIFIQIGLRIKNYVNSFNYENFPPLVYTKKKKKILT